MEIEMKQYIIETRETWLNRNLVKANSVEEAFEKVLDGEYTLGEGETVEEPTLISSMEVHNKDTIEECFNYPGGSLKFLEEMEERERIYHA
jgi:hypothetical protein